jgi:cholesterol oxidase
MSVVQGAGVGGGSLVYANISVDAKADTFQQGWPPEIEFDVMQEQYAKVTHMLELKKVPTEQWPERTRLLREGAKNAGFIDKFRPLDLAVRFDPGWHYGLDNRHDFSHSRNETNVVGIEQGTCVHLGNCDIGCDVNARNTLDLNYIAGAEKSKAEVRPYHIARRVVPINGGYEVRFDQLDEGPPVALRPGRVTGRRVILAAGSLGSTEILLRSRQDGFLTSLSDRLGAGWSSNGDFLTPALHFLRKNPVDPTHGPTITAAIDLLGGQFQGQRIFVEDGGIPDIARAWLQELATQHSDNPKKERVILSLLPILSGGTFLQHVMPWFAQGRDAADGRLSLENGRLHLNWNIEASRPAIDAIAAVHRKLSFVTGGIPITPITWTAGEDLITPHPLGGCNMGVSRQTGVVAHTGEVFGHPGLYVADGAVVPKALGLNPSKTIAALAEYIADQLIQRL